MSGEESGGPGQSVIFCVDVVEGAGQRGALPWQDPEVETLRGSCQCLPELFPPIQAALNTSSLQDDGDPTTDCVSN